MFRGEATNGVSNGEKVSWGSGLEGISWVMAIREERQRDLFRSYYRGTPGWLG